MEAIDDEGSWSILQSLHETTCRHILHGREREFPIEQYIYSPDPPMTYLVTIAKFERGDVWETRTLGLQHVDRYDPGEGYYVITYADGLDSPWLTKSLAAFTKIVL